MAQNQSTPGITGRKRNELDCTLCKRSSPQLSTPMTWRNEKAKVFAKTLGISEGQAICRACRQEIPRLLENPRLIPRWKKETKKGCYVPGCCKMSYCETDMVSADELSNILGISVCIVPKPTPLCKSHYHTVYNHRKPAQTNCSTCATSLKGCITRSCPDPLLIQRHLQEKTGFEETLCTGSKVCYACYKSQLQVINQNEVRNDSSLSDVIMKLKESLSSPDLSCIESIKKYAMGCTAVHVGEVLLKEEAMLLPAAHDVFAKVASKCIESTGMTFCGSVKALATARHILSYLTIVLEHHLSYVCEVKRYGTLLYRRDGNLFHALTCALHKPQCSTGEQCTSSKETPPTDENRMRQSILEDLNLAILHQAIAYVNADSHSPFAFDKIDIDSLIAATDKKVWSAIVTLTQTASEHTHPDDLEIDIHESNIRNTRRFFCLCMLMFCANNRCHMPLHSFITDIVDGLGGSTYLIKILNRLGICSSVDTLERRIQYITSLREEEGAEHECEERALTFISADNIDYIHSFAQVYCGKQQSSWHGTTVQAVQPMPSLNEHRYTVSTETSPQSTLGSKRTAGKNHTPIPKARRRARTANESGPQRDETPIMHMNLLPAEKCRTSLLPGTTVEDFRVTDSEQDTFGSVRDQLTAYFLLKHQNSSNSTEHLIGIQDYMRLANPYQAERSNIVYLNVLDAKADTKDTIVQVLQNVHRKFIEGKKKEWLLIEGDAKVYELVQSLKIEHGEEFKWVLPYPGDWHLLKNYQRVLMKAYYDAGLKSLAEAAGYPSAAIQSCSQFKRTHCFIMEAWESIYRVMIEIYTNSISLSPALKQVVKEVLEKRDKIDDLISLLAKLKQTTEDTQYNRHLREFMNSRATNDSTWKFWVQFVVEDAYAYVGLYLAIRSGNWELRNACMKKMAPLFTSFDHFTYRKLIAQHVADLVSYPAVVLDLLQQGSFVVNISGREWHSVAVDEAHEMLINKACKTSIVHPNKDYITRISNYLPYRAKCLENLKQQITLYDEPDTPQQGLLSTKCTDKKSEANINIQMTEIRSKKLLEITESDRGLLNTFTNKTASQQQLHDLLNFREIGSAEFDKYVAYYVLKQASIFAPTRKKRLLTFSDRKQGISRVNQLERDRRTIQQCLHKKINWSKKTGQPINVANEQYIPIPLAIATNEGVPRKGQKSNITKFIENRYEKATQPIISNSLPTGWVPESCYLEGMFMIHTVPLGTHKTFTDYSNFLIQRYILPRYQQGALTVHLIFDNPGRLPQTPKLYEQRRRDENTHVIAGHTCDEIQGQMSIPSKWKENLINCRTCKRSLTLALSNLFLKNVAQFLKGRQRLIVAGGFQGDLVDTAWCVDERGIPQPEPQFSNNAEETDTRIWRHIRQSTETNCLVVSPDTDVYMIGLPLDHEEKNIIIQINPLNKRELKFLNLTLFISAIKNDPDLATITKQKIPQIYQTLYAASGCDYVSFFSGISKVTFFKTFMLMLIS